MKIKAMPDGLLVEEIEKGETSWGRIILRNDDGKSHGVRARWAKVLAVGSSINENIAEGEYVLLAHGRWTRGMKVGDKTVYKVDYPGGVLLATDEVPEDWSYIAGAETIQATHLSREGELTDSEKKLNISEF